MWKANHLADSSIPEKQLPNIFQTLMWFKKEQNQGLIASPPIGLISAQ